MNGFVCLFNSGIDKSAPIKTIRQFINKADTCSACGTRCAQTSSANAASVNDFMAACFYDVAVLPMPLFFISQTTHIKAIRESVWLFYVM